MPGTTPLTVSLMPVMPLPGWKVTSAVVSMLVGGVPAPASPWDSAIEKQVECAAAISSSGLVLPLACSARDGPADLEAADAGRDELDLALALHQRAFPVGFRGANCGHAMTP